MRKTECSIGDLWIFSQPVDFLARKLKITWTQKDLKEKENIKRRDRGKRLEERESDLSKEEREGNIKGERSRKRTFFFLSFFICFGYHLEFLFSVCRTNFILLED